MQSQNEKHANQPKPPRTRYDNDFYNLQPVCKANQAVYVCIIDVKKRLSGVKFKDVWISIQET
jgi:hypothetical protein